jgi:cytochrome c peroxidase
LAVVGLGLWPALPAQSVEPDPEDMIGREVAIPVHLRNGEEFRMPIARLIEYGKTLFTARWTGQEGQGRPFAKGTGAALTDNGSPLVFPRNFNRISGPDTGGCFNCHNTPAIGGGGDFSNNVTVLGERFDFTTFEFDDNVPTRGSVDESHRPATLQSIGNSRKVVGMFGAGYIEMLARDMTRELQTRAAACPRGASCALVAKGVNFGRLTRRPDGSWDTSQVVGLAPQSLATSGTTAPSLAIRPFHQAGNVVSLREFTNNAFNQHHGIQSEERFGRGVDQDGDGFVNELTRADMTAVAMFQATLPVPGRVIPRDERFRAAIASGEQLFETIGCASCHVPKLPLTNKAWVFSEPNPYNPPGNLRVSDGVASLRVDLTRADLPSPRLREEHGVVMVPAYTDLKLHDITTGKPSCASNPALINSKQCDGDVEPLDQNQPPGTAAFFAGNRKFVTRKLWGVANQHAFGHHGQYTTMREAVLAHAGEAASSSGAFKALSPADQDAVIEFLKSLQILPPGTPCLVVDENYHCRH